MQVFVYPVGGVGIHFFSTSGRDSGVGSPGLEALGMVSANLSAPWGPFLGWQSAGLSKVFCQGFERGPGFSSPRSQAVLGLLFSAISGHVLAGNMAK